MHRANGDLDLALKDNDSVVQKQPENGYFGRGITRYQMGQYEKAIADFRKAVEYKPSYDYNRLYLLTASARLSKDLLQNEFAAIKDYDAATPSADWSRELVRFLVGKDGMDEEGVIARAKQGKNDREVRERLCEAYYFIAEKRLWSGDRDGAKEYFNKTLGTGASDYIEYENAKVLLQAIRGAAQ